MTRSIIASIIAIAALGLALLLTLFRYQYVKSGYRTDRVDRVTGVVCTMPCLPPTPAPTRPPPEFQAQKAIAAVKERPDAVAVVLSHSEEEGDPYEWAAVRASTAAVNGTAADDSTYVVCYCKKNTQGFRWEVHLSSGDIFYMNDNANLSHMYGLTIPSPSPSPTVGPADSNATGHDSDVTDNTESATVQSFYRDITAKNYSAAYALLSPSFKQGTTFAEFVKGYATTLSVDADVTDSASGNDVVDVTLHAEDLKNGTEVDTTYVGTWKLIPDGQGRWLLDTGSFTH